MSSEAPEAKPAGEAPAAAGGGGIKAWLPLIITALLMPVLAWATTQFVLIPKMQTAMGIKAPEAGAKPEAAAGEHGAAASEHGAAASGGHGAAPAGEHGEKKGKEGGGKKGRATYQFNKIIVNPAGCLGTRYLMTSITLSGDSPDFKTAIEENKEKLLDAAQTSLSSKTINDIERPGARNTIRAELIATFNNALGTALVQEIYFTEFAIQ